MSAIDDCRFGFGKPVPHGTTNRYDRGCRCDECRAAKTEQARRRREQKQAWPEAIPAHVHGTTNGYANYKCRCDPCRKADSDRKRLAYADKVAFRESLKKLREGTP